MVTSINMGASIQAYAWSSGFFYDKLHHVLLLIYIEK